MIKKKKPKLIMLNTRIFSNDLNNSIKRIEKWIKRGITVKVIIKQRGREIEKKEILEEFIIKIEDIVKGFAKIERKLNNTPGVSLLVISKL
ncbi:hypothetical protein JSR06_00430 [Candidatus Vidania fulgoroideae]|uniref:Translation initiation factor 3 C-terminal domain-containing protein n=1 Tax=Candidatus Vidania fulgoroideorum TaxID=881286 RepID=A0A974X959_9PROT|nr:hypothetical protein JSR06_00430 [Candidatus Vidania fulgoroideae]